ncbi:MAG TPA: hypothetical protein DEV93_00570 [Chloroflexi bacterium]|jgi:hypothetical protein|nr:hypothetical protein [Chloroflexota bacterium]
MQRGKQLLVACKQHVLDTMQRMPECVPGIGRGAGNTDIQEAADLGLHLDRQDGWFTWSLLVSLINDGRVEVVPGTERRRRFRLR